MSKHQKNNQPDNHIYICRPCQFSNSIFDLELTEPPKCPDCGETLINTGLVTSE